MESKSKSYWFWIALLGALGLTIVIAIQQTSDRRNAVRTREAEQKLLSK